MTPDNLVRFGSVVSEEKRDIHTYIHTYTHTHTHTYIHTVRHFESVGSTIHMGEIFCLLRFIPSPLASLEVMIKNILLDEERVYIYIYLS